MADIDTVTETRAQARPLDGRVALITGSTDGIGKAAFFHLEFGDFFLDSATTDQAIGEDLFGLTDAVGTVDGLRLDGGVPPRVQQEDIVCRSQIQTEAAGFQANQKQWAIRIVLESFDA